MFQVLKLLFLSCLVFGCAATSEKIIGPDGTSHQLVTCSSGIEGCYEKVREVCGGKYKIINTSSETDGMDGNVSTNTKLLVKCSK